MLTPAELEVWIAKRTAESEAETGLDVWDWQALKYLKAERDRLINVARGCHDYGGGYKEPREADIFHHGIQTVITALEAAVKRPHDGGSPLLPARSEQCGNDVCVADSIIGGRHERGRQRGPGHEDEAPERSSEGEYSATHGDAGRVENAVRSERRPDIGQSNGHRQAPGRDESSDRTGERSEAERVGDTANDGCIERNLGNKTAAQCAASGVVTPQSSHAGGRPMSQRDIDWHTSMLKQLSGTTLA